MLSGKPFRSRRTIPRRVNGLGQIFLDQRRYAEAEEVLLRLRPGAGGMVRTGASLSFARQIRASRALDEEGRRVARR